VFAFEIAFMGEIPYHEKGSAHQEWTVHAEVSEASDYAFYGSPAVGISQKFGYTVPFNSKSCSKKVYPKSYDLGVEAT
jgi:hypothetical protein